jgi:tRNA(Ile)-lysidine synthase
VRHALATLLGTVQRTIRSHAMLVPGAPVLVAVSGGSDSTGLLLVLAELRRKLKLGLVAAHVNHRLRGADADLDETCAAEAAAGLEVPFVRVELPADLANGGNLEARARRLRYAALAVLAAEHGCAVIATGHTLDDQAETVLMRLIRGSGGRGLAAIRPRRGDGVIRPLLDCRRDAVAGVVAAAGLRVRQDASNRDRRFLRTHVRERVLPLLAELNPAIATACASLAASAAAEGTLVDAWLGRELDALAPDGALGVRRGRRVSAPLRTLLVRQWLLRAGVPRRGLGSRHVAAVVVLLDGARGNTRVDLPSGWTVRRAGDALYAERAAVDAQDTRAASGEKLF